MPLQDPTCPPGQIWIQPECIRAPCPGYCGPISLPSPQLPPASGPGSGQLPTGATHPATVLMNPAAPSAQVAAAGVPANQQSQPAQDFLTEYNITPESLKAQIGPKIATAALFWIGGKVLGFFK